MTIPSKLTVDSVKQWTRQLPYANKPLVAQETFELIQRLPHCRLPARQQLQILEAISLPVATVLSHIRHRLAAGYAQADEFLPLGEAYCEHLTKLCVSLLPEQRGTGMAASLLRFKVGVSGHALALANHYLEQWYLLRVENHRDIPAGLWRHVRDLAQRSGPTGIAPVARLLALHVAGPAGMTPRRVQSVVNLLQSLSMEKLLGLRLATANDLAERFFLAGADNAPAFGQPPAGALTLNLDALVAAVARLPELDNAPGLLADLEQRWRGVRPDKLGRKPTERPIKTSIVIGLRGVARYFDELAAQTGAVPIMDEHSGATGTGQSFGGSANPFANRPAMAQASFLDISRGGCCLRTRWDGVQAGDIIAVHWGRVDWRVGSLSWIRRDDDEWECGVEWLLNQPQPVLVRFNASDTTTIGLLGDDHTDGRQCLIYATGLHHQQSACQVRTGGVWQDFNLTAEKTTGLVELALIEPLAQPDISRQTAPVLPPAEDGDVWSSLSAAAGVHG